MAGANAKAALPELSIASDPYAAASGAHCLVIATDWEDFRDLDLPALREAMAYPVVIDARNVLDPAAVEAEGFSYHPVGRAGIDARRLAEGASPEGTVDESLLVLASGNGNGAEREPTAVSPLS